jgi:hypothetical protein
MGKPGVLRASRTLNADQFFVHARMAGLHPGTEYHYRFRYTAGREVGVTPDATFITAPRYQAEPFTFTAFADEGIPGPSLDRDPSLLPESDWGMWNDGSYDSADPDRPAVTGVNTTSAVIRQITRVRNLTNGTPARFSLLAGDLCYAQAQGDIQPIINPDGPHGKQPSSGNTPEPPANSGGWDYYDPWIWTSWFPMIEPSAATIPWMFATGNHEPELFSSHVAADHVTVSNYEPIGYGGISKRLDLPGNGPSACPSVYSFRYGNVGIVSLDANDLSWEIQGSARIQPGRAGALARGAAVGLAGQRGRRLHRRLLPRVRLFDLQRPQFRPGTAPPMWWSARPAPPATAGRASTRRIATSPPAGAAARPWRPTPRARSGRTSASVTSARPSRPSTGRRPGTTTTVLSRSTSPRRRSA